VGFPAEAVHPEGCPTTKYKQLLGLDTKVVVSNVTRGNDPI